MNEKQPQKLSKCHHPFTIEHDGRHEELDLHPGKTAIANTPRAVVLLSSTEQLFKLPFPFHQPLHQLPLGSHPQQSDVREYASAPATC